MAKPKEAKPLPVELITIRRELLPRQGIDQDTVADYAEMLEGNAEWPFPPLVVFNGRAPDGEPPCYVLACGEHRLEAAINAKRSTVPCEVREGDDSAIFQVACCDNHVHGRRYSSEDKRHMIAMAIKTLGATVAATKLSEITGLSRARCLQIKNALTAKTTPLQDAKAHFGDDEAPPFIDTTPRAQQAEKPPRKDRKPKPQTEDRPLPEEPASAFIEDEQEPTGDGWSYADLQEFHKESVAEINAMLRQLKEICEGRSGSYIIHARTRIEADLKSAKTTLYQLMPLNQEQDGTIITRNDQASKG